MAPLTETGRANKEGHCIEEEASKRQLRHRRLKVRGSE